MFFSFFFLFFRPTKTKCIKHYQSKSGGTPYVYRWYTRGTIPEEKKQHQNKNNQKPQSTVQVINKTQQRTIVPRHQGYHSQTDLIRISFSFWSWSSSHQRPFYFFHVTHTKTGKEESHSKPSSAIYPYPSHSTPEGALYRI